MSTQRPCAVDPLNSRVPTAGERAPGGWDSSLLLLRPSTWRLSVGATPRSVLTSATPPPSWWLSLEREMGREGHNSSLLSPFF